MKMKLSLLAASAILAVGMTGCWTENAPTPAEVAVVAKALDGYIKGATVCVDTDNNESTCEYTTITDATGEYTIPVTYNKGKAIITGGIDLDTNTSFTGVLKAPAGSKMATPLTTLLADGMTATQITTMLGLPAGTDLSVDYRKAGSFNADLTKSAMLVETIIGQLTAIFSADASLSKADIMKSIVTNMATTFTKPADLLDTVKLTALIQAVDTKIASSVDTTNVATIVSNLASTVNTVNTTTITAETAATVTQTVSNAVNTAVTNVALTKAVTIVDNNFTVGSASTSFTQAGVFTAVSTSASNTTIGFALKNNGDELSTTAKTMDVAILIDDSNSARELKAVLKGVQVTSNGTTSTITVSAGAKLYVEGKDSNGALVSVELTDNASDIYTSQIGVTSFNLTNIMSRIEAKATGTAFANITKEGTYNISFFIGGNVTLGFDGATLKALTASKETLSVVTPSGTQAVTGSKFTGTLTVTK